MKNDSIPGIDKQVSRLAQGTTMCGSSDLDHSFELLDEVFSLGINMFDTAHIYGGGDNERTVGQWVNSRGIREKVVMIAKGAHHNTDRRRVTPFDITSDLYDSLARFKFDYIDLYILHRDDPSYPVEPIVDILNQHVREGRIRAFGGSNWTHARLEEANAYAAKSGQIPFAVSSPNFSLAEQYEEPWDECVTITGDGGKAAREWYTRTQFPLVTWSSVGAGFFSGRITRENKDTFEGGMEQLCVRCYAREPNFQRLDRVVQLASEKGVTTNQIAIAWLFNQPLNLFPLVGAWSSTEARQNVEAMDITLTPSEAAWLNLEAPTPLP